MAFSSTLVRWFNLPDDDAGITLAKLTLVSLVASNVSLFMSIILAARCAWLLTMLHHLAIWRLLVKSREDTTATSADPPPCLKHAANICSLFLISIVWLFNGSTILASAIVSIRHGVRFFDLLRLVFSGLAIIEGIALISLGMLCWKLSREAPVGLI